MSPRATRKFAIVTSEIGLVYIYNAPMIKPD